MWSRLNDSIGIILLVAVVGGGGVYGLRNVLFGPPLLRQSYQESDARQNKYTRGIMREHDQRMSEIQEQHSRAMQRAIDIGRSATSR